MNISMVSTSFYTLYAFMLAILLGLFCTFYVMLSVIVYSPYCSLWYVCVCVSLWTHNVGSFTTLLDHLLIGTCISFRHKGFIVS